MIHPLDQDRQSQMGANKSNEPDVRNQNFISKYSASPEGNSGEGSQAQVFSR